MYRAPPSWCADREAGASGDGALWARGAAHHRPFELKASAFRSKSLRAKKSNNGKSFLLQHYLPFFARLLCGLAALRESL
jgi:hypothetical protein